MSGSRDELLGAGEAADLLRLSQRALRHRRRSRDFPEPIAEVRATPLWLRSQLVEYAVLRNATLEERDGVRALARSGR